MVMSFFEISRENWIHASLQLNKCLSHRTEAPNCGLSDILLQSIIFFFFLAEWAFN